MNALRAVLSTQQFVITPVITTVSTPRDCDVLRDRFHDPRARPDVEPAAREVAVRVAEVVLHVDHEQGGSVAPQIDAALVVHRRPETAVSSCRSSS
jgi:hypothetical protein